jgi:23S rRNA (cytidine2498-2'-O)-methyltransferase
MSQFYFVLTNPEAESLLKLEISLRYPEFRMSYSRPGFLTFKGNDESDFRPRFARLIGKSLGKMKLEDIHYERAWVWKREEKFVLPERLQSISEKSLFRKGEKVTLVMMVGPEEFWVGEYILQPHHFQTPGEVSSILVKEVPSRAYYKIAEAYESFDLPFENEERVLELGSAPGGASQFLLEQDLKVLGVDPATMDLKITKHFNFKHLRLPFEQIHEDDFNEDVDWIISDVNLPPTVVMKEVERFLTFLQPRGLVLTLKINQDRYLKMMDLFVDNLKKRGFKKVEYKYLPSHRQEIALVALR